jgi:hypothetical protein
MSSLAVVPHEDERTVGDDDVVAADDDVSR